MRVIATDKAGNRFELRPIVCPVCRRDDARELGMRGGRHQRWGLGVETRIVQCRRCTLVYPNPFPFPESPQTLYGDPRKYFEGHALDATIAGYRTLARELAAHTGKPSPRILDIGAGRGDFVHAATQEGLRAEGLEFSHAMIAFAREHFAVTLKDTPAEALAAEQPGAYDAVVLNGVLEHVYDPDALMRDAAALLAPGGVLYLDLPREPNLLTWVGNAFERARGQKRVYNLQPTWPPFHVFGFNPRALRTLCKKHGVRIEHLRVHASIEVRASRGLRDRAMAFAAKQVHRLANYTNTASNMYVWARKV
jgi:SAM-dependent methyltransferase